MNNRTPIRAAIVAAGFLSLGFIGVQSAEAHHTGLDNQRLVRAQDKFLDFEDSLRAHDYDDCETMSQYADAAADLMRAMYNTAGAIDFEGEQIAIEQMANNACGRIADEGVDFGPAEGPQVVNGGVLGVPVDVDCLAVDFSPIHPGCPKSDNGISQGR